MYPGADLQGHERPGLHPYMDSSRFASEMFCFRT